MAKSLRWVMSSLTVFVFIPVIGEFFIKQTEKTGVYEKPTELLGILLYFLLYLAELPYFKIVAAGLLGLCLGLWTDWIARRFDKSREQEIRSLGDALDRLGRRVGDAQSGYNGKWPDNIGNIIPDILSARSKLTAIGIRVPATMFIDAPSADPLSKYLRLVGTFLGEMQMKEAKQIAHDLCSQATEKPQIKGPWAT